MAPLQNRIACVVLSLVLFYQPLFAADLQAPAAPVPETYFGMHIHHLDRPNPTPWPSIPVPAWRLWDADVNWPDLEPNKGQWQFQRLDRYVSVARQHGTSILLPLGGSPSWASARPALPSNYQPGFTAEPANLGDWRAYVTAVVSRYRGRIQAYDIWNEPNLRDFWTGTTDQMVDLTLEAAKIIHAADPKALLVSPAPTADYGVPWLEEFLKKGVCQYVDAIGFHFYVNPHTRPPEEMVPVIQRVRQVMAENGCGNKPLWNTETGWLSPARFTSDEAAAAFLARAYIVSWAAGVQRFYWYAWDNRSLAIVTYKEDERVVTDAGQAYNAVQQWLVGARMSTCTASPEQTWTCQLSRSGRSEWIVWNPEGSRSFEVPRAWRITGVTPLLHERQTFNGSSIDVGPAPVLMTGS